MKQNNLYVFVAASLALLVPTPGRLAFGIILILALNITMFLGTLFRKLIGVLKFDDLQSVLIAMMLVCVTMMLKLLLTFYNPIYALTLGFILYLPALSSFLIGYFFDPSREPLLLELKENMAQSFHFSIFALILFFLRDIFGYGTITLPATSGIYCIDLVVKPFLLQIGNFVASIPGTLVLVALMIVFQVHIMRKLRIIGNIEEVVSKKDYSEEIKEEATE